MNPEHAPDRRRSILSTVLIGVGMMAAVDEIVFHQILAWHHFVDRSTPAIALLSDGLLHSAELILLVLGFFLLSGLRKTGALVRRPAWSGFFLGMGGFQLFDGIVNHKVLGLHEIRYVENIWIYDLLWNGAAVLLLLVGAVLLRQGRHASS
ncbi:DUF2243 domain-containing protein [Falsirhodobacter sp. 1013]|uniref:DUF2243 domain-containing protein n=1 Tax=Falsirhodobacter sp. 1013 TaxID=3417566 RepID=UPI003EBDB420